MGLSSAYLLVGLYPGHREWRDLESGSYLVPLESLQPSVSLAGFRLCARCVCWDANVLSFLPRLLAAQSVLGMQRGAWGARVVSELILLPRMPRPCSRLGLTPGLFSSSLSQEGQGFRLSVAHPASVEWGLCSHRKVKKKKKQGKKEKKHMAPDQRLCLLPTWSLSHALGGGWCLTQTSYLRVCGGLVPLLPPPRYRKQDTDSCLNRDVVAGGQRGHTE